MCVVVTYVFLELNNSHHIVPDNTDARVYYIIDSFQNQL